MRRSSYATRWRHFRDELVQSSGIEFAISIGVNSGDVFVGGGEGREIFATGDSVNVAARLEQRGRRRGRSCSATARTGWSRPTFARKPLEPFEVKGRSAAGAGVEAARTGRARTSRGADDTVRRPEARTGCASRGLRTVARGSRHAGSRRSSGRRESGRLAFARELVAEARQEATVVIGRCLPYGEGIHASHPLIEIVRQLAGEDLDEGITELMGAGVDSELVVRRMRGLVGLSTRPRQLRRRSGRCESFSRGPPQSVL